jgi:hypothetical protein
VAIVDVWLSIRQYFTNFVIPESTKISLKSQNKKNKMTQVEPILQENKNRFVIFRSNIMTFGSGIKRWKLVWTGGDRFITRFE